MTALDSVAKHVAITEAGYTVGCAAAAAAWQAVADHVAPDRKITDDEVRKANRVSNSVLEAAQAAYISAMTKDGDK